MPQGFKTAMGSTYVLTSEKQTIRTKRSCGRGRGKTYPPHNCVYVTEEVQKILLSPKHEDDNFCLGYARPDASGFTQFTSNVLIIPEGMVPAVLTYDAKTRQGVALYPARAGAEIGLYPVEKRYEPDNFWNQHIGNKIVEIYE